MRERVFACLGSNAPDAAEKLAAARAGLAALGGMANLEASPVYETEPQGDADQPWFLNQVVSMDADGAVWTPEGLVEAFLDLEARLGRVRDPARRFGPRAIDIDLLLFGGRRCDSPACVVPHPRMAERAFVLVPLLDLAPHASIGGTPARTLLDRLVWRREGSRLHQ